MLLGELQAWSWAASGCLRRSFFVRLSYSFRALSKIGRKVEDDEAAWDMTVRARRVQ